MLIFHSFLCLILKYSSLLDVNCCFICFQRKKGSQHLLANVKRNLTDDDEEEEGHGEGAVGVSQEEAEIQAQIQHLQKKLKGIKEGDGSKQLQGISHLKYFEFTCNLFQKQFNSGLFTATMTLHSS